MHEYSVASSLLELVEEQARKHEAARVTSVRIRVGELAGVEVDLLRTAWELVRERSVAADAELAVERVPARWTCSGCDEPMAAALALRCEACGAAGRLSTGGELLLARVEMEVA